MLRWVGFLWGTMILLHACSSSGPKLFSKKTPHEQYVDKIRDAGLLNTAVGKLWITNAESSMKQAVLITLPYQQKGYFDALRPSALALTFKARRGEKISIDLSKDPLTGFIVYLDLWELPDDSSRAPEFVKAADTAQNTITHEIKRDGNYVVRIQPELLTSGEYNLSVSSGPSLAYPIKAKGNDHIKSYWGADRDGGLRKHEGLDLFAPRKTPVVAAAPGRVTRVNESNLGGLVVWMRPDDKDYVLYYAHLDSQLVTEGQLVKTGDTLGLMGNTGNARSTPPHLHFGIYGGRGAIDPLPFIYNRQQSLPPVLASTDLLGKIVRTTSEVKVPARSQNSQRTLHLPRSTPVLLQAAAEKRFLARLPDGNIVMIESSALTRDEKVIENKTIQAPTIVYTHPDTGSPKKGLLNDGAEAGVLGKYGSFLLVESGSIQGWISQSSLAN